MLRIAPKAAAALVCLVLGASAASAQPPVSEFRAFDGTGNNVSNPTWGSANTPLMRLTPNAYVDGISQPPSAGLPNPRAISNAVFDQPASMVNRDNLSSMFWQWGQFVDHDVTRVATAKPPEPFDVLVPTGDPYFDPNSTGFQYIYLQRSQHTTSGPREQINAITSFLDASTVYGSDQARADELRALDGTGRLKTSDGDLMPFNIHQFLNDPDRLSTNYYLAGDTRSNEQPGLLALHTLFVREHNFRADSLRAAHPTWTGDEVFQMARAIVAAEVQMITYRDWLPLLLGADALPAYTGYDPSVDAAVANEFATAAFRFGHSMLPTQLLRLDAAMQPTVEGPVLLRNAFFDPTLISGAGKLDAIFRGLVGQAAQLLDTYITEDVRNFLFGNPGSGGFDLVALNIQRSRDHGLPRYNEVRRQLGLAAKTSWSDVTSNPDLQAELSSVYADVEDIDVWVGGLAEDSEPGAIVGELYMAIMTDQFTRMRDGDRFWYQSYLPPAVVADLETQTLADIIRRNTEVGAEIPNDLFVVPASVAVFEPASPLRPQLELGLAFPNPSAGQVSVDFTLPAGQNAVRLAVHDAQGREVRALIDGSLPAGPHRVRWDGRDARGQSAAPGVYFFRLKAGAQVVGRRFVVVSSR